MAHEETHRTHRIGWLRAAVLGANDGIVSTASLLIGVAASSADRSEVLVAGMAGLVAGAMSMAAGEYVSVSSQADTEQADIARERRELRDDPERELVELSQIYQDRGLTAELAHEVAVGLTAADALGTHARDELGISEITTARPVQAAFTSAATFAAGAALPLIAAALATGGTQIAIVAVTALVFLAALGAVGARAGGAPIAAAAVRVTFWGALAMAVTAAIGSFFGAVV
ncbi:MAG TPA: VIT family protein [Acidimicrobiales bacterium]|nr:VIT family protein [Acidimicrobiales bacterium]